MTPNTHLTTLVTCLGLMGCCQDPTDPMCALAPAQPDGGCWSAQTEPITTRTTTTGPAELHVDGCAHMQAGYCAAGPLVADPDYEEPVAHSPALRGARPHDPISVSLSTRHTSWYLCGFGP